MGRAARSTGHRGMCRWWVDAPLCRFVLRGTLWAALLAVSRTPDVSGQEGCSFVEGSGDLRIVEFAGSSIVHVATPNLECRDGVRIRADSAVAYRISNYVQLIGGVRFEDAQRRLSSSSAEYFATVGRLQAHGSVQVDDKTDGGVMRGQEMVYRRAGPNRPREQLEFFEGRPTARLFVRPQSGDTTVPADARPTLPSAPTVPYDVEADRIIVEGEGEFHATGDVEIERPPLPGDSARLRAFGDSVEFDRAEGMLRLSRGARLVLDERELSADVILAHLPGDTVREITGRHGAVLTSASVRLEAPLLHVFFDEGVMERLVAVSIRPALEEPGTLPPPPADSADRARPVAHAQSFVVAADSLDALTPGEALERIQAVGSARAESTARDSLNTPEMPALARTDWIEGDTIVALFSPGDVAADAPEGSAETPEEEYRLERLEATGSARSLYRMTASDTARAARRPAIHYVTATRIAIEFDRGEVERMEVSGEAQGLHVEPAVAPEGPAADSSVVADSSAIADTTSLTPPAGLGLGPFQGPGTDPTLAPLGPRDGRVAAAGRRAAVARHSRARGSWST